MVFSLASSMGYTVDYIMWELSWAQIILLSEASSLVYADSNKKDAIDLDQLSPDAAARMIQENY